MLAGLGIELRTLGDFPGVVPPEETGRTFAANAREKALYYSGLEVDGLEGAPGVESARFGGPSLTYPEKFARIYDALRERGALDSPARFVCAVAVAGCGRILFETEARVEGRIAERPAGDGGFGYDPIFFYPPFGCTFGEASGRKAGVSHRGQAFRTLRAFLARQHEGV